VELGVFRTKADAYWFFHSGQFIQLDAATSASVEMKFLMSRFQLVRDGKILLGVEYAKLRSRLRRPVEVLAEIFDDGSEAEADPLNDLCSRMKYPNGLEDLVNSLQKGSGAFELI
jgi:hypothetical protein